MALREAFDRLSPSAKRVAVLATFGATALALVVFVMGEPPKRKPQEKKEPIATDILTDTDTRGLGIEGLAAQLQKLRQQNAELRQKVEDVYNQTERERQQYRKEIETQQRQYLTRIEALSKQIRELVRQEAATAAEKVQPKTVVVHAPERTATQAAPSPAENIFAQQPARVDITPVKAAPGTPPSGGQLAIREIVAESAPVKEEPEEEPAVFLPAGSIITGVLLNGMDAATGRRARRDPQPVLLRVKHDALLPNRFRADVRECALLLSGYGELSSERAFLRSEVLTCVREDGGVIEVPVDGYAVGPDGKVGVRGRLVSRQGQYLAKAALAGFAKGFASVFTRQQVPVIATTASDTTPFQSALSREGIESAALTGAGDALERLADFYLDMAEQMFPVIEIDGGRRIDVVINRGMALRLRYAEG